jgi:CheY-like chemotaxis protein
MVETYKLLIVDYEPDILLIIVRALEKYHFQIDSFSDPVKALAHFEKHAVEYSLVLSDIRMPRMSWMEFLNFVEAAARHSRHGNYRLFHLRLRHPQGSAVDKKEDIMYKPSKALDICNAEKKTLRITS